MTPYRPDPFTPEPIFEKERRYHTLDELEALAFEHRDQGVGVVAGVGPDGSDEWHLSYLDEKHVQRKLKAERVVGGEVA